MTEELSLKEARSLAKYYGKMLKTDQGSTWTAKEITDMREALSYCRGIILKKARKSTAKKELETT